MPWRPLPLSYAVAIFPFQSSASSAELPLQIGDQLYVIEEGGRNGEWCRGYLVAPPSLVSSLASEGRSAADARVFSGIFPRCCIEVREELGNVPSHESEDGASGERPAAPVPMLKIGDESPTSTTEPLVDEVSSCLREWYVLHLPDLILQQQYELLDEIASITSRLDYARRQLLHDVLTLQERTTVRDMAVWDLVRGNKMLNGEVIVRDGKQHGRLLTADDSALEMSKLQSVMGALNDPPVDKIELTSLHHALLEVKSLTGLDLDSVMLNFCIYERDAEGLLQPFSEMYSAPASSKLKTLFTDFNARDIASDGHLYLVAKAVAPEPPRQGPKLVAERPPSRNGTMVSRKDSILTRRRSSLMFGSKRKASHERPQVGSNGRIIRETSDSNPSTPIIPEDDPQVKSPQAAGPPIPRTIAVGIVDVAHVLRDGEETDTLDLKLWSPSQRSEEDVSDFDPLIASVLRQTSSTGYATCSRIPQLQVTIRPYTAPDAAALISNNPTSMYAVGQSRKMGFSEAPTKTRSDIYLTLSHVNIAHGARLSHPEIGPTPIKSSSLLNLQLTMEVRDSSGRRVEQCIHVSSNSAGVTAFRTNAAEIGVDWDQTVCLRIPAARVPECHLVLSIADAPEFPFALAWMPLWDKSAFISDGKRSLILHAYDKSTSSIVRGRGAYLSLPWDYSNYATGHDGVRAVLASLEINTKLCSTEYSQDRVLVSLISWKHASSVQLMDLLQKLVFVPEIEIVKQLNDVLDALFAILVHKSGESKFEDLIFNDIVFVLGIVHDRRFNLGPLVEQYAEHHFNSPFAASCLIRSFTRLLQSVSDPQSARDMRALFKVGQQFLKLLMASYQQRRNSRQSTDTDKKHLTFKEDMQVILFGLQMMMRSETAALVGSKTLLVQNFHSWLPELLAAYTKDEVIKIAIGLVDAGDEADGKLALYRLLMILNYTKLDQLWVEPRDRGVLVKQCLRWLLPHWAVNELTAEWKEQVRLCCSIVGELTKHPTSLLHEFLPSIISTYCYVASEPSVRPRTLTMLFSSAYPLPTRVSVTNEHYDEVLLELSALLATIGKMKSSSLPKTLRNGGVDKFIISTLSVLRSLLSNDAYPASWLSLHIYHHSSALNILRYLDGLLASHFIPDPESAENFDMELWKVYLETLFTLVSSPSLTLESFPEQKRRAVWKIAGDLRQSGADLLRQSWERLGWEASGDDLRRYNIRKLGGYQVQYVPGLAGPVLELCLSMHEGLRRVAVEMLQTMIVSEWALSEDLDLIETEFIGALNGLSKAKRLEAREAMGRKLWVGELLDLFSTIASQPDDALWTALEELVSTVDELIDLLGVNDDDEATTGATSANDDTDAELEKARKSIDGLSSRGTREYGGNALECYKQLAAEYEKAGDYKRLARVHRSIARIHEARANGRAASALGVNGHHHHHHNLDEVEDEDE